MREKVCFDFGWKFFLGNLPPKNDSEEWGATKAKAFHFGATAMDFDDSRWKSLDIPHDFVLEGDYTRKYDSFAEGQMIPAMETINNRHFAGGSLEGGIGWYRKSFILSPEYEGKRIYLHFGGVFRESTIYINEFFVGRHSSGYTSFFFDITDFVLFDKPNLLAVRVDATGREGWWYEGGGIYRHVWLEIVEPVHVAPWGTSVISKSDLQNPSARLFIETEVTNRQVEDTVVTIESIALDTSDTPVVMARSRITLSRWDSSVCKQCLEMPNAHLWSLENPYLYRLQTNVYVKSKLIDTVYTTFGVREIHFDKDNGLYLNGRRIKVNGLCHHHDHAGVGIAVPDRLIAYRLEKIKEVGCNAYRCAHHPPSEELLDLCDRMGILVMDETRVTSSANEYLDQLKKMVKHGRNHPCIFIWCLGNEEIMLQFEPEAQRIVRTMCMETKKLDPSRPVTLAACLWSAKRDIRKHYDTLDPLLPVMKEVDVAGFNYSPEKWGAYHALAPQQPMIITEATSNSGTRGCYETNPYTSGYYIMDPYNADKEVRKEVAEKRNKAERMWKTYTDMPHLSGYFVWTAFDYRGEPSPMRYPAISTQFGIMDYCGFQKDSFYYYKSWWDTEPVLHIFPHWNWPDKIGEPLNIYCYSNLDSVELFVNGQSQGIKRMDRNWYLEWEQVTYQPGVLLAVGYKESKEVLKREIKTTSAPSKIELLPDRDCICANGQDLSIITVRVVDEEGLVVPDADHQIFFHVKGTGRFLGVGNGNPGSHESDKLPVRRAFHGLCQMLIQSGLEEGTLQVEAKAAGLESASCSVRVSK